jgi:thioredoxin reductase (NADPH)
MIRPDELKAAPIFACLTDTQRVRIAQNAAELFVKEGEWLIREGEAPWFFVLLEGCLDVEKEYGGSSIVRARYRPGDFYGETPIMLNSPAIASLRAHEPSRVVRLDRMQFRELIDSSPECSDLVVKVMMKRVTMMQENMRETNPLRVLVIGSQYDAECRDIRAFLSMNRIPYEWQHEYDPILLPPEAPAAISGSFVIVDRSTFVGQPLTVRKVADALGICTAPPKDKYDVVVIGGGPAGLAAAVYGASEGLSVLLIEKNAAGGQAGTSSRIENYPGFPNGISGDDLSGRFLKQATRFGAEMVLTRVVESIKQITGGYSVELDGGLHVKTKTIVLATGVDWRRLVADGVDRLLGKGVLYGATRTEASTVVGKDVFIVGGGNSAGQAAMFFSGYAASVTLLVRGKSIELTMSQYLIDQLAQRHNIFVENETRVVSVLGDDCIEAIETKTNSAPPRLRRAHALFVMIGARANTEWLPKNLERDDRGFVCTGRDLPDRLHGRMPFLLETNLPGIFCAGDVRHDSIKRVSSSVGEGSMTIAFVHQYFALEPHQSSLQAWQASANGKSRLAESESTNGAHLVQPLAVQMDAVSLSK